MDWSHELLNSMFWIIKAFAISTVMGIAAGTVLIRSTVWGRQFWQLTGAFFSPRQNLKILGLLLLILLLTLGAVRVDLLLAHWSNGMYTSLQRFDAPAFWASVLLFAILASIHVVRTLIDFYIRQVFVIRWREWLNEQLLAGWLNRQAFYRTQFLDHPADNPDQRLQQDITSMASISLSLAMGTINALVSIFSFTLMLWGLSGALHIMGIDIPRGMVFMVFIYVLLVTVFAIKIGFPLVRLNFLSEQLNANYRYALMRVREYAENIAFYRGENVEGRQLRQRFASVIDNAWQIVYRSLKFQGFNFVFSQISVLLPLMLQAQRFFSKQISLGDLMQTARVFGNLHDSLSFFRMAYDDFAGYRAVLNRLSGFNQAIDEANALPVPSLQPQGNRVALQQLRVNRPNGEALLLNASLEIPAGQPLLIRGRSGAGKTTLLRAMAGLWPYCEGQIIRPDERVIFLSQKPYLPLGTLRDALYYPSSPPADGEAAARQALLDVQLGHLVDKLDTPADWSHILSLGEQQRLAFGRLLVGQPLAAFLDEATSAMDEELENELYLLLCQRLPNTVMVSVGHRSTLFRHHPRQLELTGTGQWVLHDS